MAVENSSTPNHLARLTQWGNALALAYAVHCSDSEQSNRNGQFSVDTPRAAGYDAPRSHDSSVVQS
ncbi:MAG: hypothetical protein N6V49_07970, partial [Serratia symbiotica]|nr:hypothetical protein [Serratia symbiotica]